MDKIALCYGDKKHPEACKQKWISQWITEEDDVIHCSAGGKSRNQQCVTWVAVQEHGESNYWKAGKINIRDCRKISLQKEMKFCGALKLNFVTKNEHLLSESSWKKHSGESTGEVYCWWRKNSKMGFINEYKLSTNPVSNYNTVGLLIKLSCCDLGIKQAKTPWKRKMNSKIITKNKTVYRHISCF